MNRRTKLILTALSVAVLVAIAFLTIGRTSTEPSRARVGYLNITASAPLFIAEEKGYFAEEGVAVEASRLETSNQLVDGIIAGNLDAFVEASAVPVLAVHLQSPGKLKIFAASAITKEAPFDALLVPSASMVSSLRDLQGKTIGVFPGTTASHLLRKYLTDQGVAVAGITFVPIPPQNHLTALAAGSVDAIHAYEPTIAIALADGRFRKLHGSVYAEMLDRNPQGVAAVSTAFLEQHPDAAKRTIRALERAMVFMRENEQESRDILAKRLGLSSAVANQSVFLYMLPHDEIDPSILQRYADMLTGLGELGRTTDVSSLIYRE